jgi:hypothetical protein
MSFSFENVYIFIINVIILKTTKLKAIIRIIKNCFE